MSLIRDSDAARLLLESRYRNLSRIIAATVFATGAAVVLGWILGIEWILRLTPSANWMRFNAALCLMASGWGVWALAAGQTRQKILARCLGIFVLLTALLTLSEHAFGWDLHLDQLFWRDIFSDYQPGRMVAQTAIFFVWTGAFLVLSTFEGRGPAWTGQIAAIVANLTAQGTVLNLIFREDKGRGAATHTVAAAFALSMGMLLVPNRWGGLAALSSGTGGGRVIRRLVPVATLAPLATGWIYLYATDIGWLTRGSGIVMMVMLYSGALLFITVWTAHSIETVDMRLTAIVDSSNDAIVSKSTDGTILTWNHGAERLYGYTAAEAIGQSMLFVVPPELHEEVLGFMDRIRHGERVQHRETVCIRKDGTRIDVSLTFSPVMNGHGEITGCSAISRDITERKRAEDEIRKLNQELEDRVEQRTAELRETEQEVRRKLESILSPEGDSSRFELRDIFDIPAVQSLLDDLCRLTRLPVAIIDLQGEVIAGAGWQEICTRFHRVHCEAARNCLESDVELSKGVAPGEIKLYKCKNNMWDVVTPIMLGSRHIGNLFSGQFLLDDDPVDTELFAAQAKKYGFDQEQYLSALGLIPRFKRDEVNAGMAVYAKLAENLSQLGYSGIKLARSMAEANRANVELTSTSKELEAFAYSVSHDLRAPLRHLDGFLTLLSRRSYATLDERAKHYIDCTLEASQRMGRLIDELLQFSRLGRSELHKTPVSLNRLVDEVRKELEPEWRGRTIDWQVQKLPVVSADQAMMRQVMENLVGNALKFTRHRPAAKIAIEWKRNDAGDLVVLVNDNGAGFDMRYANKLFQVFQRLHGEDEFEGTGIGLANVKRIVDRHGGQVWAEGMVGSGATFYFSLPGECEGIGGEDEFSEAHLVG